MNQFKDLENEIKHLARLEKIDFVLIDSQSINEYEINSLKLKLNENVSIMIKFKVIVPIDLILKKIFKY